MKKVLKKTTAMGLTVVTAVSMAACGSSKQASSDSSDVTAESLGTITVMTDTTVRQDGGGDDFWKQLEQVTGLSIKYVQPDHSGYLDAVANAFNSDEVPDVVQLSSDYYQQYAANGMLWDMTDAWANSEVKKSGRLTSNADAVVDSLRVAGPDGQKRLYGFSAASGNGCQTYVKKSWLEDIGMSISDIQDKTLDFNTYYDMLKKMTAKKGHYAISAPGFIAKEAPWTNYLPEFYQDAQYTFYQDASGKYVDGFSEQPMKDAIKRIKKAVDDGVMDKETVNNTTSNSGTKFKSTDPSSETGVWTYWAGTWENTLQLQLKNLGLGDGELIRMNPIKEVGAYLDRIPPCWAITSDAEHPEALFKYFVEAMFDGDKGQTLWVYGAENTHWSTKAEDVTLAGAEDKVSSYKEGEFHCLPTPGKESTLWTRNCVDPLLLIVNFKDKDPGYDTVTSTARESEKFFVEHSKLASAVPVTEELTDSITNINTARNYVIAQICLGYMSLDEGYQYYNDTVGNYVKAVLDSLNK